MLSLLWFLAHGILCCFGACPPHIRIFNIDYLLIKHVDNCNIAHRNISKVFKYSERGFKFRPFDKIDPYNVFTLKQYFKPSSRCFIGNCFLIRLNGSIQILSRRRVFLKERQIPAMQNDRCLFRINRSCLLMTNLTTELGNTRPCYLQNTY